MRIFGKHSTTGNVLSGLDLTGKRVLVTGVSSGLGVETARALVSHGAQVVGAARDLAKARLATEGVRQAAVDGGGSFELVELDLTSLASIRACSDRLLEDSKTFDIVIANAGVMATPLGRTADGFETQFGTNHLGHFLLVNRVAPMIADNGRLVVLSSAGHRMADINLDDPNFERSAYDPWVAYARSKTANSLFAVEFDRRHRGRGIRAAAVMPGVISTGLIRHMTPEQLEAIVAQLKEASEAAGAPPLEYKTIEQGAATSVWAAVVADGDLVGGRYCENCSVADVADEGGFDEGVRSYALDQDSAKRLWAKSEELVEEHF
ncbi:SDR family NAD(P)-dependent oxidoreductase (plasmid) [Rhizobium tumorigenes]|uniref:Probable oxidoreductase n=2 Tax=Rhizobium tumorigenes TaxID=2041385 RepID=A0AAF1KWU8_9HYPH|nr:SDR family NAD(P)-dependent oxidoreductase [Rhizobium tumorigenes]WFR98034.1 SDR family NAD(P)-dependent oxidoreductase [Rhizobium tumorigenes]WFS03572.1 SDR family NAD(P)-dependent oxidoreductase [Rhizobium tumorigenes]